MKNLVNKTWASLTEEQRESLLNRVSSTLNGTRDGEEITVDFENGLSIAATVIESEDEITFEISDEAVLYNPIQKWKHKKTKKENENEKND